MAGAGYKLFNTGDVLTAAQVNTYLQEQVVMRFATTAARTTALSGVLAEGMMSYIDATDTVEVYNGSAWVTVGSSGDITDVNAGTGITVTNPTGPAPTVALTVPVAATNGGTAQTTYATGDLLYASASNTLAKRAIGTTGQVLTVSGGVPTWATAASGSTFAGCYLYNSTNPSISNNSYTLINFDTELFDTDAYHSNTTNNSRITVPSGKAGYYLIVGKVGFDNGTNTTGGRAANLIINGTGISYDFSAPASGSSGDVQTSFQTVIRYLAVGDYVQMNAYQNSGGSRTLNQTVDNTYLSVAYLGA